MVASARSASSEFFRFTTASASSRAAALRVRSFAFNACALRPTARDRSRSFVRTAPPAALIRLPDLAPAELPDPALVARLRRAMTDGAGVVRDGAGLAACLRRIAEIEAAQPDCPALLNMTATATLIAAAALMRRESRGAHFRTDFPQTAPEGRRSRLTLAQALALRDGPTSPETP